MGLFGKKQDHTASANNAQKDETVCPVCGKPLILCERYCRYCGTENPYFSADENKRFIQVDGLFGINMHCEKCGYGWTMAASFSEVFCPNCRNRVTLPKQEDPFERLSEEGENMVCSNCGQPFGEEDVFCRLCGAKKGAVIFDPHGFIYGPISTLEESLSASEKTDFPSFFDKVDEEQPFLFADHETVFSGFFGIEPTEQQGESDE